ncbi:MAG: crotonase [Gammaproteobacteria bacterium]|nr:crotonase [Gammaproteobacteria bacterium]
MNCVLYEVINGAAWLTINRPEQRNALSDEVFDGLLAGLQAAKADSSVRAVVLTGAGGKAFCAGGDLKWMNQDVNAYEAHFGKAKLAALFRSLWELGKPTIARVQGYCLAGGMGVALACDFVVASDDSQFGIPEVKVGLWPYMITVPILHALPPKVALRLMLTGDRLSAEEGFKLGFVSDLVPPEELDTRVESIVAKIRATAPQSVALGRTSFYTVLNTDMESRLRMLEAALSVNSSFPDAKEGMTAFAQKRPPRWESEV